MEAWLVLALIADKFGHPRQAVEAIRSAVELASPERDAPAFLDPATSSSRPRRCRRTASMAAETDKSSRCPAIPRRAAPGCTEPDPLVEPLTERELAILGELPTMESNAEIAKAFYISANTVKAHLKHLYRKLDVSNRREAVRRGRELGLIP